MRRITSSHVTLVGCLLAIGVFALGCGKQDQVKEAHNKKIPARPQAVVTIGGKEFTCNYTFSSKVSYADKSFFIRMLMTEAPIPDAKQQQFLHRKIRIEDLSTSPMVEVRLKFDKKLMDKPGALHERMSRYFIAFHNVTEPGSKIGPITCGTSRNEENMFELTGSMEPGESFKGVIDSDSWSLHFGSDIVIKKPLPE